jgi:hypothetical protein
MTQKEIGVLFNLTLGTINNIITRKSWKNVILNT